MVLLRPGAVLAAGHERFRNQLLLDLVPFSANLRHLALIVWQWGKGAYCGWICSCGGMAETLGDEYRANARTAKRPRAWTISAKACLAAAVVVTAFGYFTNHMGNHPGLVDTLRGAYKLSIDVFFAGVLGLESTSSCRRIWCRYGCPLAALMHIYSRFSKYRIFAEKKKCISCNICTKVCHMGIDVMNYANKGVPMNDVEMRALFGLRAKLPHESSLRENQGGVRSGKPHPPGNARFSQG